MHRHPSAVLLLALFTHLTLAQELPTAKIDERVKQEFEKLKTPAISVAIGQNGKLVYAKAWGLSDLENKVAVTPDTLFRTASIAKPITAAAVVQLAAQGKLDLDKEIQEYAPEYPKKEWPITARQLLGHLGGVRHYARPNEAEGTGQYLTVADSIQIFADDPLSHEPGSKYLYTTFGYTLLGRAVETASGKSYREYMTSSVFAPAGMVRTRIDDHYLLTDNRARGYAKMDATTHGRLPDSLKPLVKVGDLINASLHDTSMKVPGGGLLSTPSDLVRFGQAMLEGRLVSAEWRDRMWTKQKLKDGSETTYGLGWSLSTWQDRPIVSHSGGQAGTSTLLYILPKQNLVIAIMTNLEGTGITPLMRDIGRLALGEQLPPSE